MSNDNPKRDPNEINVDPATVLAVTLAVLLVPLLLVGIFSH
jgi:preprotein translocase subunit Sec61beta